MALRLQYVERINKIPTVVGPMPNVINTMLKE